MVVPRVSIEMPPGQRACGGTGSNNWTWACDERGVKPFLNDLESLKRRFPSDESRALFIEHLRQQMSLALRGKLPWEYVMQMAVAPDVLEIRMQDWWFSGGKMHVRLYYTEPRDVPGTLVALRLLCKRPGPIGLEDQDSHARSASDLLLKFQQRGYR